MKANLLFNKNISNAIESNVTLAYIFIVFFFYENFSLLIFKKSIIFNAIDFSKISLMPTFCFFIFIALSKFVWTFLTVAKASIKPIRKLNDDSLLSKKISIATMMLSVLITTYCFLIPIAQKNDNFLLLKTIYISLMPISALFCFIVYLISPSEDKEIKNTSKESSFRVD